VLTASATVPPDVVESFGFRVLRRPVAIEGVTAAAAEAIRSSSGRIWREL
jgi:hypothetical protein